MIPEQNCLKHPRKDAVLDLVWSAAQDLVQAVSVGEPLCNRDHSTIRFNAAEGECRPKKSSVHILNFRKGNYVKMRQVVKKMKVTASRRGNPPKARGVEIGGTSFMVKGVTGAWGC